MGLEEDKGRDEAPTEHLQTLVAFQVPSAECWSVLEHLAAAAGALDKILEGQEVAGIGLDWIVVDNRLDKDQCLEEVHYWQVMSC